MTKRMIDTSIDTNMDMGVEIEAGTKALHERDCAALAARDPSGTSTTTQRGENRTDEDPNQDG